MGDKKSNQDPLPAQVAIPLGAQERAALAERWTQHPGMQHLGARADFSDPAKARVYIDPLEPHHRGGMGTEAVNGAVTAGLFDVAVGIVGHFHTMGRRAGTAQLAIQFIRPVLGDRIEVEARLVRAGTNLVFVAGEAFDQNRVLCARCDGIVAVSGGGVNEAL
jgi:acyl-coenzyme A thioesterase PaaI-like protein